MPEKSWRERIADEGWSPSLRFDAYSSWAYCYIAEVRREHPALPELRVEYGVPLYPRDDRLNVLGIAFGKAESVEEALRIMDLIDERVGELERSSRNFAFA